MNNVYVIKRDVDANGIAWRFEQFQYGWNMFTAREALQRCQNAQQRDGWYAALDAEAVATLPANSANRLGF